VYTDSTPRFVYCESEAAITDPGVAGSLQELVTAYGDPVGFAAFELEERRFRELRIVEGRCNGQVATE